MKNEVIREAREGSAMSSSIFSLGQLVKKCSSVPLFSIIMSTDYAREKNLFHVFGF